MANDEYSDELARIRAVNDQSAAAAKEFAITIRAFYDGMIEQEFTVDQAMSLTLGFLAGLLASRGGE